MSIAIRVIEHIKNVTDIDITLPTRKRYIVELRVIYAQIMLKNSDLTTNQTARYLNKDHATIIHYRKLFDNLMAYSEFRSLYSKIISGLVICNKTKKELLEERGWNDVNELLIKDILKIYA